MTSGFFEELQGHGGGSSAQTKQNNEKRTVWSPLLEGHSHIVKAQRAYDKECLAFLIHFSLLAHSTLGSLNFPPLPCEEIFVRGKAALVSHHTVTKGVVNCQHSERTEGSGSHLSSQILEFYHHPGSDVTTWPSQFPHARASEGLAQTGSQNRTPTACLKHEGPSDAALDTCPRISVCI